MVAKTLVAVASFVGMAVAEQYIYFGSPILGRSSSQPLATPMMIPTVQPVVYTAGPAFYPTAGRGQIASPDFQGYPARGYGTVRKEQQQLRDCDFLDGEYEINVSIDRQKRSSGFSGYMPYQQATVREIPSTVVSKQYHSQDEFGNYKYGYTNPNFEKHESGNANSEVKGHYSYIDENGNARRLYYVADEHGFHITGDDVPGTQTYLRHKRSSEPRTLTVHEAVPTTKVPDVLSRQYHAQDDFGNYKYGYVNPHFEKHESGNADTEVRGHYRYIDGNGLNRIIEYIADQDGFHVKVDGVPDKASFNM